MNTPPRLRSRSRPKTPSAPLHGPLFSSPPGRRRKGASSSSNYSAATLSPPPSSPLAPRSPEQSRTPKKRRAAPIVDEGADVSSPEEGGSDGDEAGKIEREGKIEGGEDEIEKILEKSRKTLVNPGGFGLPTPAKTPSRKRKHIELEEIAESARVLFPAPSSPKASSSTPRSSTRRTLFGKTPRQKKGGMVRFDLANDDPCDSGSINIFTDSNARIPKLDTDPNNPFVTRQGEESSGSKRKKSNKPKADLFGEDARREDGMVYVFRGKKVFKKFTELDDPDERLPSHLDDGGPDEPSLERSAVRPRLLFPPKHPKLPDVSGEEEAETDVEGSTSVSQPSHSFGEAVAVKSKQKEPLGKRDISRMTPESEEDTAGNHGGILGKGLAKRRSVFDAGEDGLEARGAPAKGLRVKRGREDTSKPESPRKARGKRARV